MPRANPTRDSEIRTALSGTRVSTYLAASGGSLHDALELYGWNARMSAALMLPAHFAEVSVRNAVDEVLTSLYGADWPWSRTLETSLPSPQGPVFNPRHHLQDVRTKHQTTGKVVADMKFVFWPSMFTARHDGRLWVPHIHRLFPGLPAAQAAKSARARIAADLNAIRVLRNRIAHHEPIFTRDLATDLGRMLDLVDVRSAPTAAWTRAIEDATRVLAQRP